MKIPDPNGFTLRHRKRWRGSYHLDPLLWVMMDWFIDHAMWEDKTIKMPGKKPIFLKRGQVIFSERKLSKLLKVGRQRIRSRRTSMILGDFLTHESTQGVSIATIVNYNRYQSSNHKSNPETNHRPTQGPTHVPYKELVINKRRAGDKSPTKKEETEKKQIAEAAQRRIDTTTKYLNGKTQITPVLEINSDELKEKIKTTIKKQDIKF